MIIILQFAFNLIKFCDASSDFSMFSSEELFDMSRIIEYNTVVNVVFNFFKFVYCLNVLKYLCD